MFARARENARRASCQSNLKQIGLGFAQYTQDYDEKYPLAASGPWAAGPWVAQTNPGTPGYVYNTSSDSVAAGHWFTWADAIFPYIKSTQIFACPSAQNDPTTLSYGYNTAFNDSYSTIVGGAAGANGVSMASVKRPSETLMLMDANNSNYATRLYSDIPHLAATGNTALQRMCMPHLEGGNIAYADGHVKWANLKGRPFQYGLANLSTDGVWNPFID